MPTGGLFPDFSKVEIPPDSPFSQRVAASVWLDPTEENLAYLGRMQERGWEPVNQEWFDYYKSILVREDALGASEQEQEGGEEEEPGRRPRRGGTRRRQTLLTGSFGIEEEPPVKRKTLLGR